MDFSEFTTEQIETVIADQQATIARATTFRAEPGVGSRGYDNYTRTIEQAQQIIAEYQAELTRRAAPAPQEEIAPVAPPFTATETTIQAADLAAALTFVKPAFAKNSYLPVIQNVILETVDGALVIRLTNLELFSETRIPARGQVAVTVPFKALAALVGKTGDVTIRHIDANRVQIAVNGAVTELPAIEISEAPRRPDWQTWAPVATIPADVLHTVEKQVAYAASTDTNRPVLAGVLWRRSATGSVFAGADGFRLATLLTEHGTGNTQDILPAPAFAAFAKLTGTVTIYRNEQRSQVVAGGTNGTVYSRTIDGNFPNYDMIIPTGAQMVDAQVDAVALSGAVKQLSKLVSGRYGDKAIGLRIVDQSLILAAASDEGTGRIELPLMAPVARECMQAVNCQYILDTVAGHKGEVTLSLNLKDTPLTIRTNAQQLSVIMPMHLNYSQGKNNSLRDLLLGTTVETPSEPTPVIDDPAPVAVETDATPMAPAPVDPAPAPVVPDYPDHIQVGDFITDGLECGIVESLGTLRMGRKDAPGYRVATAPGKTVFIFVDFARKLDTDLPAPVEMTPVATPAPEPTDPGVAVFLDCPVLAAPEPAPVAYDMPVFMSSRDAEIPAPAPAPDTRWDAYPVGAVVRSRSSHLTGTIRRPGVRQGAAGVWLTGGVWLPLADAQIVPAAAPVPVIPMAPARVGPVGWETPKPVSKPLDKTPGPLAPVPVNPVLDPVPVAAAVVAAADALPVAPAPVDRPRRRGSYRARPLEPRPLEERPIVITICGVPRPAIGP